jgi:hypothetical protein
MRTFKFQSTPHFISRANQRERLLRRELSSFNPRPTSSAGRTPGSFILLLRRGAFQSTPHFISRANLVGGIKPNLTLLVSIHAPLHQQGELSSCQAVILPGLTGAEARTAAMMG